MEKELVIPKLVLNHKNLGKDINTKHRLLLGLLISLCDTETGKVVVKYGFSPFKKLWDWKTHKTLVNHLVKSNILEVLTEENDALGYQTFLIKEESFWCNRVYEKQMSKKIVDYKDEVTLLYANDQKAERNRRLIQRRSEDIKKIVNEVNSSPRFKVLDQWLIDERNEMILRKLYVAGVLDSCEPARIMVIRILKGEWIDSGELSRMVNFATRENNLILTDAEAEKMALDRMRALGLTLDESYTKLKEEKEGIKTTINRPQFDSSVILEAPKKTVKRKAKPKRNPFDQGGLF